MYENHLNNAVQMAKRAGAIQLSYFRGTELAIRTKSNDYDVVTRADMQCEELIAAEILTHYPDHAILGEEGGCRGNAQSDYLWVVDPLDGTTNFSQGLPIFSVSIGLQYKGETVMGVVYAPYLDELYTAVKGGGAYLTTRDGERRPIHVAVKQGLSTAVLATGFPVDKDRNPDNNSDNVARIVPHIRDLRRFGSAAYDLCAIASGVLDGYWELALHEWDVCAGELIVREAGGEVHSFREERGVSIVAGSEAVIKHMLQYIR